MLKTPVCLKCGYDSAAIAELSDPDVNIEPNENTQATPIPEKIETHEQVRSIFTDMAMASGMESAPIVATVRRGYIPPAILGMFLVALAAGFFWRFVYFTPDYASPLVLSAADIKAMDGDTEIADTSMNVENEKNVELETGLEEGNFTVGNFAQFGDPGINVFIQAFNLRNVYEKFGKADVLEAIQKEYDISDDDADVYFSKGFAYYVPDENLDRWGFAIGVNNKEFVEQRLVDFTKKKENPKYAYSKYFVDLVEVDTEKPLVNESTESAEEVGDDEENSEDEESEKAEGSEEEATEEDDDSKQYYLLVSNSNEYLDQMKESSEGNLTNLANEVIYANSKSDLPQIGEVLIYKSDNASVWDMLADIAASKYSYVGLDKVLKTIQTTGAAFYSVDSKLRISLSEN